MKPRNPLFILFDLLLNRVNGYSLAPGDENNEAGQTDFGRQFRGGTGMTSVPAVFQHLADR